MTLILFFLENRPGFVLADEMVKAIKEDLHVGGINEGRVRFISLSFYLRLIKWSQISIYRFHIEFD